MLDERKCKILQAIIDDYISTAEPVGSRTIARKYNMGVGPATIRNEMADLEVLGYLEQPHTSAGRIPSAKGYRFYVDCLMSPSSLSEQEINLINNWYHTKVRRIEEVFQETAKILSRLTRNISLVVAPQFSQSTFKYMQFLPLDETRAILVVVTDTGYLENKVIAIPEGITMPELQRIAAAVNSRLAGLQFNQIKSSLIRDIRNDVIPDHALFEKTLDMLRQALTPSQRDRIYLGGTTQMLNQPEFRDVEKAKGLLTVLEEEKLLADILESQEANGVVVTIGQENKFSGIQDLSVIQATYRVDGQVVGKVAVLGPTRIEYSKVMSVLDFMHRHLGEILKKYGV
ncbi:MAG: heat-inducible transcriptional repressor HrcA [Negativicutes bacterium]|nr:heat-inducible transcriptional repressor HrcA [Negativicutes bacterium]